MWGKRKKQPPALPFTRDQYTLVRDFIASMLIDPEFGVGTEGDESQRTILDDFTRVGLLTFDQLLGTRTDSAVESQLAHDVMKVITRECLQVASEQPDWPAFLIAEHAFAAIEDQPPFTRLNEQYAVHRAEQTLLEAACTAFIDLAILEAITDTDPRPGLESVSQVLGLVWLQWFVWSRPLDFAASQGRDVSQ